MTIDAVMALAAGEGKRMHPLSIKTPKPLLTIGGEPLLRRALAPFLDFGRIIVNGHYKKEQLRDWLAKELPQARFSDESRRLDSGGGVKNALKWLPRTFFVVNGDSFLDGSPIAAMRRAWDGKKMDALLLLHHPRSGAVGYKGRGDYSLESDSRLTGGGDLAFTGVQILSRRPFAAVSDVFPLRQLYDSAEAAGRLYGLVYSRRWYHVGDPQTLQLLNRADDL